MRPRRARTAVAVLALIVASSACSTGRDAGVEESVSTTETSGTSADSIDSPTGSGGFGDCAGKFGHPCVAAEIETSVRALQARYSAEVNAIVTSGTLEDAYRWIAEQEDIVDAQLGRTFVVFQVAGGMPTAIISPIEDPPDGFPAGVGVIEASSAGSAPSLTPAMYVPRMDLADVVGRGTDRENDDNHKRALFLEPWASDEGSLFGAGGRVEPGELLGAIRDYDHVEGVLHRVDQQVTPEWFKPEIWRMYDFIYVSTHGAIWTDGAVLETGVRAEWDGQDTSYQAICDRMLDPYRTTPGAECGIEHSEGRSYVTVDVNHIFFIDHYLDRGLRLDKTVVYIEACESLKYPALASAIAGSDSAYLGWTSYINLTAARHASGQLLVQLTKRGRTVGASLETLCDLDQCGGERFRDRTESEAPPYLKMQAFNDAKSLRLYDLPTLRNPKAPTSILESGSEIEFRGTAGDDEPDELDVSVEVIGVIDPNDTSGTLVNSRQAGSAADLYQIRFLLDGEDIGLDNLGSPRHPTATSTAIDETTFRYTYTASLDFDVPADGHEVTLEVLVDLPEGGVSRYKVDVRLVEVATGATITVGGQTWEFELADFYGGCIYYGNGVIQAAGFVNGDLTGVGFSAELGPDGGQINVEDPAAEQKWMAAAERAAMTVLHLVPDGHSQIDTISIDGSTVSGTATFIETRAFSEAWSANTAYPDPVTGSFEVRCQRP